MHIQYLVLATLKSTIFAMQNPHYYILNNHNPENSIFAVSNRVNSTIFMTNVEELSRSNLENWKFDMTNVHIFKTWLLEVITKDLFSDTARLTQLVGSLNKHISLSSIHYLP